MLDATNSRQSAAIGSRAQSLASDPWRDGIGFRTFLGKVKQRRSMLFALMLVGFVFGGLASVAYLVVRMPAFSATSELLISNTTLQLSGPDAVVTQILVENSLIQSAMEMVKSSAVLERVIVKVGLDDIEQMLPKPRGIRILFPSKTSISEHLPWAGYVLEHLPWKTWALEPERSEASRVQAVMSLLRSSTVVNRVGASQIVSVRARALRALDAAKLTNAIAEAFVQEQNETNAVVTTSAALRERIKVLGPTARIISEGFPPLRTDELPASLVVLLATLIGGALAVGGGVAATLFDRRLRSAEQLTAATSLECFGCLPRGRVRRKSDRTFILRRAVLRRVRAAVLERSMRVPHVIGVTSFHLSRGRTSLAANLARFVAEDGSRVLLVGACEGAEAPSGFGQGETQGLYELLRGAVVPSEVIVEDVSPGLDFLPSGTLRGDVDTLWGNLADAINGGERCYDWVILDLPPLAMAVDVRAACQVVEDLVVAVEWGASEARLEPALRALGSRRDRIAGTVIDKVPWSSFDPETQAACHAFAVVDQECPQEGTKP